ncbi:citrate lyase holo-[acyl-carrier protein] synthase [Proteiniclasticum sp.]|uniref:citrate lyase holo-[acyl-carrier protein] synthase n=1 Tax=Proteiniclasticum sp. TaxID=2053595 RepID=UPI00289BDECF|nr:citrate lyase holo-[acyl-carrier protein] synthase [Proteiniclasticum sp.]
MKIHLQNLFSGIKENERLEILDLREERDAFERELLKEYGGSLLTLRANFPGEDKRHTAAETAVRVMEEEVRRYLHPVHEESTHTREGYIVYLLMNEDPLKLKKTAVEIEEKHPLGRLVDMDVRSSDKIFSRGDFNLPPRLCYLCSEPAVHCVRSMKHSLIEVREHFIRTVENHRGSISCNQAE